MNNTSERQRLAKPWSSRVSSMLHPEASQARDCVSRTSSVRSLDQGCPVCMEEAGSKVAHITRKKGDRQSGVMRVDLAAFEASADGNKYGLVAAVTIEIDKESRLLPICVPTPKKDAACACTAIKEAPTLCQDRNLHQITGSRVLRIQADGGGEFSNEKLRALCWEKNIILSFSPAHQPSSNGIAERMVGVIKSTVHRMLQQASLGLQAT